MNKTFTKAEQEVLEEIVRHRRDVRGNRFLNKAISKKIIDKLISAAINAPSVGFSQPWEFVIIQEKTIKEKVKNSFNQENLKATAHFKNEKQKLYTELKLEGIIEAPVNIAVFYKPSNTPVLGQTTMEEVGVYSVVCAIQNMWLMARALNIGMGWVSILDPERVKAVLNAPEKNTLIAYLCIGYVTEFLENPELETLKWEERKSKDSVVLHEQYPSH